MFIASCILSAPASQVDSSALQWPHREWTEQDGEEAAERITHLNGSQKIYIPISLTHHCFAVLHTHEVAAMWKARLYVATGGLAGYCKYKGLQTGPLSQLLGMRSIISYGAYLYERSLICGRQSFSGEWLLLGQLSGNGISCLLHIQWAHIRLHRHFAQGLFNMQQTSSQMLQDAARKRVCVWVEIHSGSWVEGCRDYSREKLITWTEESFSADSSPISTPNSSSRAITISTASRESAPRSSTNLELSVTFSSSTPSCLLTMDFTLSRTCKVSRWT